MTEKIQDKTWSEAQEPEFLKAVTQMAEDMEIAAKQNILMVNLFNQYAMALHQVMGMVPDNGDVSPQVPEPANRAERRAASKRKTPLDVVKDK